MAMPGVNCSASDCAFNDNGCNAYAVTIAKGGCATFIALDEKGGLGKVNSQVWACQLADCKFNKHLLCQADSVKVGDDEKCLTFATA